MTAGRVLRGRACRAWIALLLLPALAFRMLVPAGFMPSAGDGFAITMQMCHGDARSSVIIRLGQGDEQPVDRDASHSSCVFATTSATAPPPVAVVPLASVAPPEPASPTLEAAPLLRNLHRPQSPRAPPSPV
jgi:hypothetical protein